MGSTIQSGDVSRSRSMAQLMAHMSCRRDMTSPSITSWHRRRINLRVQLTIAACFEASQGSSEILSVAVHGPEAGRLASTTRSTKRCIWVSVNKPLLFNRSLKLNVSLFSWFYSKWDLFQQIFLQMSEGQSLRSQQKLHRQLQSRGNVLPALSE